jgi:hypothetical protein
MSAAANSSTPSSMATEDARLKVELALLYLCPLRADITLEVPVPEASPAGTTGTAGGGREARPIPSAPDPALVGMLLAPANCCSGAAPLGLAMAAKCGAHTPARQINITLIYMPFNRNVDCAPTEKHYAANAPPEERILPGYAPPEPSTWNGGGSCIEEWTSAAASVLSNNERARVWLGEVGC